MLALVVAGMAVYGVRGVVAGMDHLLDVNEQNLLDTQDIHTAVAEKAAAVRGYLLTGEEKFVEDTKRARHRFLDLATGLQGRLIPEGRAALDRVTRAEAAHQEVVEKIMAMRRDGLPMAKILSFFDQQVLPRIAEFQGVTEAFVAFETNLRNERRRTANEAAEHTVRVIGALVLVTALVATLLGIGLSRTLSRQVGSAVQHVQSASAELQAAATQQATSSREAAASLSEVGATFQELVATARQIAESARRVAQIAGETAGSARGGDDQLQKTREAVGSIKRQVDAMVAHMLDLGKKSQQIGDILEIINELAEQTNILSINATIEAAGAGEAGRRFAVVADEIRKLADRVGGSTRDVRTLIDEIRSAVNATVMATEGGARAVEVGTHQFGEVTSSFEKIVTLVGTTTEAAREIELSTKQQTSAVEQVNVAIAELLQMSRETDKSAGQTLQTSTQLVALSTDLARLVQSANGR